MADNKTCKEHISSVMYSYLKELEYRIQHEGEPLGLSTGIKDLDETLGGMRGGEVILLGARPGMGKTSFAIDLSYKIAKSFTEEKERNPNNNKCVLYFSIKYSKLHWLQRFISAKSNLCHCYFPDEEEVYWWELRDFSYGTKFYEDFEKIANVGRDIEQLPIYICDDYPLTLNDIKDKIEEISCYSSIGFIVIDYLTLINRENFSHDEVLQELKNIAQKLNIPIFILSQLTTDLERRKYKFPHLKDIREFKKHTFIDKILFLHRDYYYLRWNEPTKKAKETDEHFLKRHTDWEKQCKEEEPVADIIVAKNSTGHTGIVFCSYNMERCEFDDLPQTYYDNL